MTEKTKKEIRPDNVYWPRYGSFEAWICQALNIYVNSKEPFDLEEKEYASCWTGGTEPLGVECFKISETPETEEAEEKERKGWDPLEILPPPCLSKSSSPPARTGRPCSRPYCGSS